MGNLQVISKTHLRVVCQCGKYIHELQRGDDGEVQYQSFMTRSEPEEKPEPKKAKKHSSFFDVDGEG